MFEPLSQKQERFLVSLICKTGREKYLQTKNKLGYHGIFIQSLTRAQAARLIGALKKEVKR